MSTNTLNLDGPKIMLLGSSGTGKSRSIGTLVDWAARQDPPFEVFVYYTENSLETLIGYWADSGKKPPANLSWFVNRVPAIPLESLISGARDVGALTYESLCAKSDPGRHSNNPWLQFLTTLQDLKDERTGKTVGNIGRLTRRHIFALDSLSEAAVACFRMQIGNKPVAAPKDYMVAQQGLVNWIRYMTQSLQCTFAITAHPQKQVNELTGAMTIMTEAIGKALGDQFPKLFSEVIYTVREGNKWYWDTAAAGVDLKSRYLPVASKLEPDFAQIMDRWVKRAEA